MPSRAASANTKTKTSQEEREKKTVVTKSKHNALLLYEDLRQRDTYFEANLLTAAGKSLVLTRCMSNVS